MNNLSFSAALVAVKSGKGMQLPIWHEEVTIRAQIPDEGSKMTHPYLYVTSRHGMVPWIPTQVELFSQEWRIVD